MKKLLTALLLILPLLSMSAIAESIDLETIRNRDGFYYDDDSRTEWTYGGSVAKKLTNGTLVKLLVVDWGNDTKLSGYPELRIFVTSEDGDRLVPGSAVLTMGDSSFELTLGELDVATGGFTFLTSEAEPLMRSILGGGSLVCAVNTDVGTHTFYLSAKELAPIRNVIQGLIDVDYLNHINQAEKNLEGLYNKSWPIICHLSDDAAVSEDIRNYTLDAGPFTLTLNDPRLKVVTPGMPDDDPVLKAAGISAAAIDSYLALDNTALMIYEADETIPTGSCVSIKIKDEKYLSLDLRTCGTEFANTMLSNIYSSFISTGATDSELLTINGVPYLRFNWMSGTQQRYATIINGDMIYIWFSNKTGTITDGQKALLLSVVESIEYPEPGTTLESEMKAFKLSKGPLTVTLDTSRYVILTKGMQADDTMLRYAGMTPEEVDEMLDYLPADLLMYENTDLGLNGAKAYIKIKDRSKAGVDLPSMSNADAAEYLQNFFYGFSVGGTTAFNEEYDTINGIPYVRFDWSDNRDQRYATVVDEDMIYIGVVNGNGITDSDTAMLRMLVDSITYGE